MKLKHRDWKLKHKAAACEAKIKLSKCRKCGDIGHFAKFCMKGKLFPFSSFCYGCLQLSAIVLQLQAYPNANNYEVLIHKSSLYFNLDTTIAKGDMPVPDEADNSPFPTLEEAARMVLSKPRTHTFGSRTLVYAAKNSPLKLPRGDEETESNENEPSQDSKTGQWETFTLVTTDTATCSLDMDSSSQSCTGTLDSLSQSQYQGSDSSSLLGNMNRTEPSAIGTVEPVFSIQEGDSDYSLNGEIFKAKIRKLKGILLSIFI
jgi:hypothetical protein